MTGVIKVTGQGDGGDGGDRGGAVEGEGTEEGKEMLPRWDDDEQMTNEQ